MSVQHHRGLRQLVRPLLSGVLCVYRHADDPVEEQERPEYLGDVPEQGLGYVKLPRERDNLEPHQHLAYRAADDVLEERAIEEERGSRNPYEHEGKPSDAQHAEEYHEGDPYDQPVDDYGYEAPQPVLLECLVLAKVIKPCYHGSTTPMSLGCLAPLYYFLGQRPLRSPVFHHRSAGMFSSRWRTHIYALP